MRTCPSCGQSIPEQFRICGYCGAPLEAPAPPIENRRTVTIVFSDLKGSTALGERLDPEAVREVLARYFDAMRAELERHGGTIEKFIGDAVMAVFGLDVVHEDDALRAVRAAAGMGAALEDLNTELEARYGVRLTNRTGVNTGEVVAGDPTAGQRLVTGDTVNTTARLEQAAPENQILLGPVTHALVRDEFEAEPVEPLVLKGKAEPVPAWRLVRVRAAAEGRARREDTPLVGRAAELEALRGALAGAVATRSARLVVLTGDAGVGKSRLVRELMADVEGVAVALRGRCLSYGEGITFWPIGEIVRAAAGIDEADSPAAARTKLLAIAPDRDVAARVASIVGLSGATAPLPEAFWGVRRLLEELTSRRPILLVVDDIHWAEPALLDLLDHLLGAAEDAPILVVATARPEFADEHPGWPTADAPVRIALEPLGEMAATAIVANLAGAPIPPDVARSVVAIAEGNPLFVEQLVETLIETGAIRLIDGRWVRADEGGDLGLPPSIQALVAARLDRITRSERGVLEPASVIGLRFAEPAVADLVDPGLRADIASTVGQLVRRRLILPETAPSRPGDELEYRFGHQVIRDVAYQGILKRTRATLHERFVAWADRVNADRDRGQEFEEILGYHLEQAYRYRGELGPLDEASIVIGRDGARRLAAAGSRAFERGDMHAAANLLRRASALLDDHDPARVDLAPDLAEALLELGELELAETILAAAIEAADELFDDRRRAHAVVMRRLVRFYSGGGDEALDRAIGDDIDTALAVFERAGDELGQARAWRVRFGAANSRGAYAEAAEAAEQVIIHARAGGDRRLERRGMTGYALAALYGPTPVPDAIVHLERLLDGVEDDRRTSGLLRCLLAQLQAMNGDIEAARLTYRAARAALEDLGRNVLAASVSLNSWRVEMLARDPAAAERELRRDHATLEAMGERYLLSTVAGALAMTLIVQGRLDEAEWFAAQSEDLATDDDVESQALWRGARARIAARRGDVDEARRQALGAVAAVAASTSPWIRSGTMLDAADTMGRAGQPEQALAWLAEARDASAAKGDVATEGIAAAMLEALGG
jgi:class 3 adenylate cyclase/tetratricopeptide (TPR) repeat protein